MRRWCRLVRGWEERQPRGTVGWTKRDECMRQRYEAEVRDVVRGRRGGLLRTRADWKEIERPSTVDVAWEEMSSIGTEVRRITCEEGNER